MMADGGEAVEAVAPLAGTMLLSVAQRIGYCIGLLLISGSLFASLLLVLAHFNAVELSGCGAASDCARAAGSRWGKLPGARWPLSFVGFAYFQALAAAYVYGVGRMPVLLRCIAAVGAAVSVVLTAVMFAQDYLCVYCLTIHVLNVIFVVGYEARQRLSKRWRVVAVRPFAGLGTFAGTLVLTTVLLAFVEQQSTADAEQATAEPLQQALAAATTRGTEGADTETAFEPGRYTLGSPTAKVHITVVSDYSCPSCRRIDAQLRGLVASRDDVSISARHFPFCTDCNDHIDKTRHPNACRAAVAAEAAGIAGGADAFWRMHDWLFERGGRFTDEELVRFVAEAEIPEDPFREALASAETIELIRADADAADAAGLRFTPMVFINGVPTEVGNEAAPCRTQPEDY